MLSSLQTLLKGSSMSKRLLQKHWQVSHKSNMQFLLCEAQSLSQHRGLRSLTKIESHILHIYIQKYGPLCCALLHASLDQFIQA